MDYKELVKELTRIAEEAKASGLNVVMYAEESNERHQSAFLGAHVSMFEEEVTPAMKAFYELAVETDRDIQKTKAEIRLINLMKEFFV
jgi:CRISPR/Cas system-associated endoribonuclease Cas2